MYRWPTIWTLSRRVDSETVTSNLRFSRTLQTESISKSRFLNGIRGSPTIHHRVVVGYNLYYFHTRNFPPYFIAYGF